MICQGCGHNKKLTHRKRINMVYASKKRSGHTVKREIIKI